MIKFIFVMTALAALGATCSASNLLAIHTVVLANPSEPFHQLLSSEKFRAKNKFSKTANLCRFSAPEGKEWYSYLSWMNGTESGFESILKKHDYWSYWSTDVPAVSTISISGTPIIVRAPIFPLVYPPLKFCTAASDATAAASIEITKQYAYNAKTEAPPEFSESDWSAYLKKCANSDDKNISGTNELSGLETGQGIALFVLVCGFLYYRHYKKKYGVTLDKTDVDVMNRTKLKEELKELYEKLENAVRTRAFEKEVNIDKQIENMKMEMKAVEKTIKAKEKEKLDKIIEAAKKNRAKKEASTGTKIYEMAMTAKENMPSCESTLPNTLENGLKDQIENEVKNKITESLEVCVGERGMKDIKKAKQAKKQILATLSQFLTVVSAILSISSAVLLMGNYISGKLSILDLKVRLNGTIYVNDEIIHVMPEPFGCDDCDYSFIPSPEQLQLIENKIARTGTENESVKILRKDANYSCAWKAKSSCSINALRDPENDRVCQTDIFVQNNSLSGFCDCGNGRTVDLCEGTSETVFSCHDKCNMRNITVNYQKEGNGFIMQSAFAVLPKLVLEKGNYEANHTVCVKRPTGMDFRLVAIVICFFFFVVGVSILELLAEFENFQKINDIKERIGMNKKISLYHGKLEFTVQDAIKKGSPIVLGLPMTFLMSNLQDAGEYLHKEEDSNVAVWQGASENIALVFNLLQAILVISLLTVGIVIWNMDRMKCARDRAKISYRRLRQKLWLSKKEKTLTSKLNCFSRNLRKLYQRYVKLTALTYAWSGVFIFAAIIMSFYYLIISESVKGNLTFAALFFSVDLPIEAPKLNLPAVYMNITFQSLGKLRFAIAMYVTWALPGIKGTVDVASSALETSGGEEKDEGDDEGDTQHEYHLTAVDDNKEYIDDLKEEIDDEIGESDEEDEEESKDEEKKGDGALEGKKEETRLAKEKEKLKTDAKTGSATSFNSKPENGEDTRKISEETHEAEKAGKSMGKWLDGKDQKATNNPLFSSKQT
jgi:hypothetical protein